jgi:5-formyltetrahydrofolate cyclo-ligase
MRGRSRGPTFQGLGQKIVLALKVPRECPFIPLIETHLKKGKRWEMEKVKS